MLLLMWLAGCLLVALASAALSQADAPWLLGLAALMAAQAAVLAGRAARLPALVTWPVGLGFVTAYAVGYGLTDLGLFVGLAALLMLIVDRFAGLSFGLSPFLLEEGAAAPDPIARDFARVRRERSPLTVASISAARPRGSSRRLAQVAHALVALPAHDGCRGARRGRRRGRWSCRALTIGWRCPCCGACRPPSAATCPRHRDLPG